MGREHPFVKGSGEKYFRGGAAIGGESPQRRDDLQIPGEPFPGEGRAVRPLVAGGEGDGFADSAAE